MVDHAQLRDSLAKLYPGYRVASIEAMGPDGGATRGATAKAEGYGKPKKIVLIDERGEQLELVWRVAASNDLGHDRRADRAAASLLAYDDFARIPQHVRPIDVGGIREDGALVSLRGCGELYLITTFARGELYAEELRRIAHTGATDRDVARVDALARYLAELHVAIADPAKYRRAIRDLIGHGEGIFGMVDAFPDDVPGAPRDRLDAIERRCVAWRARLRGHASRLVRSHGDFHPFNVVFEGDQLAVLDASRGGCGDAADDVTAMAINFLLFAFEDAHGWHRLGPLWHRFWRTYAHERPDPALISVAPPFFAWRALVVSNPRFYPALTGGARDALLGLAERALDTHCLDPRWADELFR